MGKMFDEFYSNYCVMPSNSHAAYASAAAGACPVACARLPREAEHVCQVCSGLSL